MIKETNGDLLKTEGIDIICHQVNYCGIMGAGIAKQIKDQLLSKKQFEEYRKMCELFKEENLGTVFSQELPDGRYVANMFSQNGMGGVATNYTAMKQCFQMVKGFAAPTGLTVGIPGYIGCGIAGGDWNIVKGIIENVFDDDAVDVVIVYFPK